MFDLELTKHCIKSVQAKRFKFQRSLKLFYTQSNEPKYVAKFSINKSGPLNMTVYVFLLSTCLGIDTVIQNIEISV